MRPLDWTNVQNVTNSLARRPFSLPNPYGDPLRRGLVHLALPLAEKLLALSRLNAMHAELAARPDCRRFEQRALEALGVSWQVSNQDLSQIPARGGLIVVANHPFGGLDGLLLAHLLRRVRPDVKLLGNSLLASIPELRDTLLFVDPFGGRGAGTAAANAAALRHAVRWVRGGGALGIFPAGEVSHARLPSLRVTDPTWDPSTARLLHACRAPALAVFFEGRNSALFQIAGLAHPRLRTLMLPRELLRQADRKSIRVRVGNVIPIERIESLETPEKITGYLRARTYVLKGRAAPERPSGPACETPARRASEPIIPAVSAENLQRDVAALPAGSELARSGNLRVLCARSGQLPSVLQEIGRLREIAFRLVGEGTGRCIDLDRFDGSYLHLFIWNDSRREVAGAYRMGPTDEILPRDGIEGLYTSSLFHYRRALLDQIGPALEMGRSFVRPEYQRHHAPLALLWKGIGRFVVQQPRYRCLFGTVSISNVYQSMSRSLLLAFLKVHRHVGNLARWVRPRSRRLLAALDDPDANLAGTAVSDLAGVDELVREIEADRRSMPVLLRQYLKLNGKLLGFTVDPAFGDVLDGLILVDLARVDGAILGRYMGAEGARSFLSHHHSAAASVGGQPQRGVAPVAQRGAQELD